MTRPATLPHFATVPTVGYPGRVAPNAGKLDAGYQDDEAPPAGEHNWLFGESCDWIAYLDDERDTHFTLISALQAQATAAQLLEERGRESIGVQTLKLVFSVSGNPLRAIAWSVNSLGALGSVCAVGDNGAIATRTSGSDFSTPTAAGSFTSTFTDVVSGHAGFVAVGDGGQIQQAPDGLSWSQRKFTGANLTSVAWVQQGFSGGLYVAVGLAGDIWTSTNGTSFTQRTGALGSADLVAIECALGLFIVTSGDGRVQTSPDGITWTQRFTITGTSPRCLTGQLRYSAALGFVALYNRNGTEVGAIQSDDGLTWTGTTTSNTSGIGAEANLKLALLDHQAVYLDIPTAGTARMTALVYQTAAMPSGVGSCAVLPMVANVEPFDAENILGQLWVVGNDGSGNGVIMAGARFRPNSVGAL